MMQQATKRPFQTVKPLKRVVTIFMAVTAVVWGSASIGAAGDLALIDPTVLKGELSRWVVLDARSKEAWESGHLPGAQWLSWENLTRTDERGVKYASLPVKELEQALAAQGLDERSPVVIYGDADTSWGGEGYGSWLLCWLGHKGPVRLLKGGIQGWSARRLPISKGPERARPRKARYVSDLKPQYQVATQEIQRPNAPVLVDVRSTFEWIKGSIPGAVHIPWEEFYTGKERQPLPPAALRRLLTRHGVDPSRPIAYYCLGGIRSAYAWTVHQLAGLPEAKNYKGGWAAWEKRSGQ